jgi:hypothetical protein
MTKRQEAEYSDHKVQSRKLKAQSSRMKGESSKLKVKNLKQDPACGRQEL